MSMLCGRRRWTALSGLVCALLLMVFSGPLRGQSRDRDDEILKRLRQLEERVAKLEQGAKKKVQPAETKQERPDQTEGQAQAEEGQQTVEVQELRRQVGVLAEEIEKMRSGEKELSLSPEGARALGLGPAAAAVYRKSHGVSIAGYGEMLYQNFGAEDQAGTAVHRLSSLDFLRGVLYAGYRFNDRFLFNSELELEHASTGEGDEEKGEASWEFAYIDYLANPHLTIRGGLLLMPMGLTNEFHEPTVFLGTRRSETETHIIPSTWRETGFGVVGSAGIFNYRAYLVNGLDASGFSPEGLREGRQGGSKAKAADLAFVGRLDVTPRPGLMFGGSLYRGNAGQNQFRVQGRNLGIGTTIGEVHSQVQLRGVDFRGLYARADISDAALLNQALGLSGQEGVASTLQGGYLQFGYNLLSQRSESTSLTPYYRFEKLETQSEVALGFQRNPSLDRTFHTLGMEFKPIYNIVIKSDFQWVRNPAKSGVDRFNIALGYSF